MKKNPPTLLIFGGVAALAAGYYFMSKKKGARAAAMPTRAAAPRSVSPYRIVLDPSGGKSCFDGARQVPLTFCTDPATALEGYFSTGDTPCCSGCAQGRGCEG